MVCRPHRHCPPRSRNLWPLALGMAGLGAVITLTACSSLRPPKGVHAVQGFSVERYAGHWHEVARIDHHFEKGLENTSAQYVLADDGSVKVVNRGWDPVQQRWREARGRAVFLGDPSVASLKVSFFGPFYGGYHVVALDDDYRWSMVIGSSLDYFWILARTPQLPSGVRERLLEQAQALGVDVDKIVWVPQEPPSPT